MNKEIAMITLNCPICGKLHEVEKHVKYADIEIKGVVVNYLSEYFICQDYENKEENQWCPGKMYDENLLRARDAYRQKSNLLTSDQIIEIRQKYGLSQKELSNLFGWGDVTVSRYETKAIQDEIHDKMLRALNKSK